MKKVEIVRFWLDQDVPPKEVARRVPCALSLVYEVKGLSGMAGVRHELGVIQEELREIQDRLRRLEGSPADILERMLTRKASR
jgi:hypothetical protein